MARYYVYKKGGRIGRIAKIENGACPYGWDQGRWIPMPGLIKINFDITDYQEIGEAEAFELIAKK